VLVIYSTANGSDCLHAAVSNNLPKVVDILCQKGAQIDRCDCTGESALWLALSAEQADIADILVSREPDGLAFIGVKNELTNCLDCRA
jgi:ankyrin repeat protein